MVDKYVSVRTKLQSKIFTPYGITVSKTRNGSPVYNDRGEVEDYTASSENITMVPYNYMFKDTSYQPFGNLQLGDTDAAIPYDTDIDVEDLISWNSISYKVTNIEKNYLKENVVTIIRLSEVQT